MDVREVLEGVRGRDPEGRMWVYVSGPNAFIEVGKGACKKLAGVDWYAASWEV